MQGDIDSKKHEERKKKEGIKQIMEEAKIKNE